MSSFLLVLPDLLPVAAAVVAMLVAWVCWISIHWVWLKPKALERCLRKQGLSGNPYKVLYGDLNDFSKVREEARSKPVSFTNNILPRVIPELQPSLLVHGKNYFAWMGPIPMVYITQPDLIREVFTKMVDFGKSKLNPVNNMLAPGVVQYDGEKWNKHRKMLNPAFHIEKLKLMLPAFYSCCVEMMNTWETMSQEMGSIELDVWPYLVKLSADVISRAAFGSSFEKGERIFKLLMEQAELTAKISQTPYIPGLRFMQGKMKRMKRINDEIEILLMGIIEKRKKAMEVVNDDLLGMLMENAFDSEMCNNNDHKKQFVGLTKRELIDECKLFYFAGQETTSALIVWTLIMLSKHQDWQKQAREEVLNAFGKNKPDFDGLNQLKKVTMILYEVLRLYTPIVTLRRRTKKEVKLGDLCLPADVMINIPVMLVHQDPQLWGNDALDFRPERFSEGIVKATGGNNAFFPFGWGPRICIGQSFALLEVKLALAIILQRFSFELSPYYTHAPWSTITLQPQFGAHIVLRKLSPS